MGFVSVGAVVLISPSWASGRVGEISSVKPEQAGALSLAPRDVAQRSQSLREALGLSLDRTRVERLANDRGAVLEGLEKYGIPLTADEEAELGRRERVAAAGGALQRKLGASVDSFGGSWVDHSRGGMITLAFTDHVARRVADARRQFAYPERLRGVRVARSSSELEALRDKAVDGSRPPASGATITGAGIDAKHNQVRVSFAGDLAAARRTFAQDGDAIGLRRATPRATACTQRNDCAGPLRGGLVITNPTEEARCTTAFVAYKSAIPLLPGAPASTVPEYFLLSAGHCDDQRTGSTWNHGGQAVGPMTYNSWGAFPNQFDFSAIPIPDDQAANWVYTRSTGVPYPIRAVKPLDEDQIDDVVCISVPYVDGDATGGSREGSKCGLISETGRSFVECADGTDPGVCHEDQIALMEDQVLVTMTDTPGVQPGDSGGPAFSNGPNTARGIIHGNEINDLTELETNEVIYGQVGHLFPSTDSPLSPGLRVLTTVGPGGGTP